MNKLMQFFNGPALRMSRALTNPTRTLSSSVSLIQENTPDTGAIGLTPVANKKTTLYSLLTIFGSSNVSIVPRLDQWLQEGGSINASELIWIINDIEKFNRFNHALEISEWISDKFPADTSGYDHSIRLRLISKVHGLKEAEHYFDNIPDASRKWCVYYALLICYANAKSLDKAEATMQKSRELGYAKLRFYYAMLDLYFKMKKHKRAEPLFQEMEEKGTPFKTFAYGALLICYVKAKSLEKAEATMQKMRELGYAKPPYYNAMLNLYSAMKKHKKLDLLIQEMEEKGIPFNRISPGVILNAYAASANVEKMEKLLTWIENPWSKQVYTTVLICYAAAESLEKAEATMQRMREMGCDSTLSYNVMVELYSKMKKHEKLNLLIQEMEERGICFRKLNYGIRLNAYAASAKLEQMEKLLTEMEDDPGFTMRWNHYTEASNGFLNAGATEKALIALKISEQVIRIQERRYAYESLLTLYASLGKKDEVYRIWNLRKGTGVLNNDSYLSMMSSLAKLDDLDGIEKMFEEWEVEKTEFDYRLPNLLITTYCKKGLLKKAESFLNRLRASGKEPNASILNCMALAYSQNEQKHTAAETMKKAILASLGRKKKDAD